MEALNVFYAMLVMHINFHYGGILLTHCYILLTVNVHLNVSREKKKP